MKKKYMGVSYSIQPVGARYKWSVADCGMFNSGFADNAKAAEEGAESYIKGQKRNAK